MTGKGEKPLHNEKKREEKKIKTFIKGGGNDKNEIRTPQSQR